MSLRTLRSTLPALACWLAGMLAAHHPILLSGFRRMQTQPLDTRFINYILEHGWRWLLRAPGHERFWDPAFYYPAPNTAAYSEVMLGVAPFYWIWRAIGLAPDTSLQCWMLTLSTLNFWAAYAFLRRALRVDGVPAAVGAFVFAFGGARLSQLHHQQLLAQFYMIGALYACVRLFEVRADLAPRRARHGWIALFAVSGVAQLYASFYQGWFLGFALIIAMLAALVSPELRARLLVVLRRDSVALLVACVLGALAVLPLGVHDLAAAREVGMRTFDGVAWMLPRPHSWLYMGWDSWLYDRLASLDGVRNLPAEHEQRLGLGLVTSIVVIASLWRERHRPLVRLLGVVAVAIVGLTTIIGGHYTLWRAVFELVPGARAIRAVARIGLLLLLPAAVGVALFLQRARTTARPWAIAAAALVIMLEQGKTIYSYDKLVARQEVARLVALIPERCDAFFFSPRFGRRIPWNYQVDAMWAQLDRGVPTINGYSGSPPPGWTFRDLRIRTPEHERQLSAALDAWAARWGLDRARLCWISPDVTSAENGGRT